MRKEYSNEYADEQYNEEESIDIGDTEMEEKNTIGMKETHDIFSPSIMSEKEEKKIQELKNIAHDMEKRVVRDIHESNKKTIVDYKNELNQEQYAAVCTTQTPLLVIAGAGSGKTRTIIYKVAYLIEHGVAPQDILLLTFTKKAAHNMLTRVNTMIGNEVGNHIQGGTFHSFSNTMLRRYGSMIGVSPSFTILDTQDASDSIALIKKEIYPNKKEKTFPNKKKLQDIISRSRNIQKSIEETIALYYPSCVEFSEDIEDIAHAFTRYKKTHNIVDFDDMMEYFSEGLKTNKGFRETIQKKSAYILVDEYQDTNNTQREIVECLAKGKNNITVVGDDAQSIYSFRGANYENILRFPSFFPSCQVVKIEQNYRSTPNILNLTNEVIANARIGFEKNLKTKRKDGVKPTIKVCKDKHNEAEWIVEKILTMQKNGIPLCDIAILVRSSWYSNSIQAVCVQNEIPFVVYGGFRFDQKSHIKDIVAFLKIVVNSIDAVAWTRILTLCEGVGSTRATQIINHIRDNKGDISFFPYTHNIWYKTLKKYEHFYTKVDKQTSPFHAIETLLTHYKDQMKHAYPDDHKERMRDVQAFLTIAQNYKTIEAFISDFTLEPPNEKRQTAHTQKKHLTISTIHSAKGLEWKYVFIPHMIDGFLPSRKSLSSIEDIEEERRLFYVATSRAMDDIIITLPEYVMEFDTILKDPSRFIKEIDKKTYSLQQ